MIQKLIQATLSGKLQWERTEYKSLYYRAIEYPDLLVSCYRSYCHIVYDDQITKVDCQELQELCDVIHKQITRNKYNVEQFIDHITK